MDGCPKENFFEKKKCLLLVTFLHILGIFFGSMITIKNDDFGDLFGKIHLEMHQTPFAKTRLEK